MMMRPAEDETKPRGDAPNGGVVRDPSPDLFRVLVSSVKDYAIFALDPTGRVLSWNAGAERIKGYRAQEILGRHFSVFYTEPDLASGKPTWELEVAAAEGRFEDEGLRLRKDGTTFWANVVITALRDQTGRLVGFAKVTRDLTERRAAEQAARQLAAEEAARAAAEEAEHRAAFLAEASRVLAGSLDYEGTLQRVVRLAVPELADWCAVELQGTEGRLELVALAHADPEKEAWARAMYASHPRTDERSPVMQALGRGDAVLVADFPEELLSLHAKDADDLAQLRALGLRSQVSAPMISRGRVLGVISLVSTDRSHRRYTMRDLTLVEDLARRAASAIDNARLYSEAVRANEAKANFLAVMSHELRTPLNAILGYTDLLAEGMFGSMAPLQVEQLGRIRASSAHLTSLVEEILAFARIEAGQETLRLAPLDVSEVVREVRSFIEPMAQRKQLELVADLPAEPVETVSDAGKVRQILLNLLSNAVKFTEQGEVRIRLTRGDGQIRIEVRDTGVGIPAEHLESIFDPFWQVEQSRTRRTGGTGLGLSVARQLVRLLEGELIVESTVGRGSVFTVVLRDRA